jgi:tripartite-type tricarboxylate transporter receptor subunit TctC
VKIIVPFPPGANTDTIGRLMGQKLGDALGQQFFVENRGGAGGMLGADAAAKSPPDGYTIFFSTTGVLSSAPALRSSLSYDPVKSFAPISVLAIAPVVVMVQGSVPVNNLREFIEYAKARPGKLTYGSAGVGHFLHVAGEAFNVAAGTRLFHVPYKGAAQALTDMLAGRLDVMIDTIVIYRPHVESGKFKALAVGQKTRIKSMPDLPTTAEAGLPGYEFASYFGLVAPAGTPPDVVRRLNAEVVKALAAPDVAAQFAKFGVEPMPTTPDEYSKLIADELTKWKGIVQTAGIKLE